MRIFLTLTTIIVAGIQLSLAGVLPIEHGHENQTVLIALGGFSGEVVNAVSSVEIYSLTENVRLKAGASLPGAREASVNVKVNNTIYVLGGFQTSYVYDNLWAYDIAKDQWNTDLPNAPTTLFGSAVAELDGRIYVMGGNRATDSSSEVYVFDTNTRKWNKIDTQIPETSEWPCATAQNNSLYYMSRHNFYQSTDRGVTWQKLSGPLVPRDQSVMIPIGSDAILFVGGRVDLKAVQTVELYNITTDSWTALASLGTQRRGLGVAQIPGSTNVVVACGGHDVMENNQKSCEVYNWENNKWNGASYSLEVTRIFFGMFVVSTQVEV